MNEAAADAVVTLDAVTVRSRDEALLNGISLAVARHHVHVIVGPNGAGKSTLLTTVLGQRAFSGRILLNWRGNGAVGYVPQSFPVDPTLPVTVADFLALTRQRRPICLGLTARSRQRVPALLRRVGLDDIADRPLAVLSGGELRRVLLAHALDPVPELLVLDEPTAGLDDRSARWLEDALHEIRAARQTTVLMVSHDLDQVRRLADRVTVIDRDLIADDTPERLLGDARVADLLPRRRRQVPAS